MCSDIARCFADRCLGIGAAACLSLLLFSGCGGGSPSAPPTQDTQGMSSDVVQLRVGKTPVLTHHNDNSRSGLNLAETRLTLDNVAPATFGKLAAFPVQGYVYAQPLYVPNVSMPADHISNLVIVATEHDQLYAFDVDSNTLAWHVDYLAAGPNVSPVSPDDVGCTNIVPEIGITSTPVIDPVTHILYVLVRTKEVTGDNITFYQRLHAVEIATGRDLLPPTVVTGPPSDYAATGFAKFDPLLNNQRAALMIGHQQVYVAWASHCDYGPYTGWLMSFDENTLLPTAYWTPVPYSAAGGIWMSGSGPSLDANGDIYVPTSNGGENDPIEQKNNFRSSLVRLHWSASDGFSVVDYFSPYNYQMLDNEDLDFGSSGALLLPDQLGTPHPHLLVVRDKAGTVYVLDRDDLGKWQMSDNSQAVQTFVVPGFALSSALFWNKTLYIAGGGIYLEAYSFDPVSQQFDPNVQAFLNYPVDSRGPTPSLSANRNSNAILWAITDYAGGKNAVLHALDALDISKELYNSNMVPARDQAGPGVKFVVPTIADGLVFVGTQNEVDMYGLLNQ